MKKKTSPKRYWLIGGIATVVVIVAVAGYIWRPAFVPYVVVKMSYADQTARRARIIALYNSLQLPSTYKEFDEDIFGEKRQYSWDKSRTQASVRTYVRDATPSVTLGEISPLIDAAGFKFVDEPYPNEIDKDFQYKDDKGEYLRLHISSKPRDDALRAAGPKGDLSKVPDGSGGPSNVEIRINLDDNND